MSTSIAQPALADRIRSALAFHGRNGWAVLRHCSPWILLVPAAVICLIVVDSRRGLLWFEQKTTQEIIAPSILAIAILVSSLYWARAADFCSHWLLLLSAALFCRELHFWGTNNGIYLAIILLLWYASRHTERMRSFLQSRCCVSLFAGAVFTYGLSKTFDRGYWMKIAGWPDWQDTMEESLESTAHLMILALAITAYLGWGQRRRSGSVQATSLTRRFAVWGALTVALASAMLGVEHWSAKQENGLKCRAGFPLELSSLCNVDPQLGHSLFLAGSDEVHKLTLWTLDESETPKGIGALDLKVPLADGSTLHLDDLEDLAWDELDTYYAVSSHRHLLPEEDAARRKKSRGTECALVSFQLDRVDDQIVVKNPRMVTQELLSKIRTLGVFPSIDWHKSKVFSWRGMVKTWQLDIEGLAYVDDKLLLGFKDPIEQGRATILSYDPACDELALASRPDLNGQGILGMHYDRSSDCLLLLSNNPIKHRFGDSCLWIGLRDADGHGWSFSRDHRVVLEPATAATHRKASGLTIYRGKMAVCFDSESEAPIQVIALKSVLPRSVVSRPLSVVQEKK